MCEGYSRRTMQLNARRICRKNGEGERIFLAIEDMTDREKTMVPNE